MPTARSSAATGSSTRWSRTATSRARKATRPRPSRSASTPRRTGTYLFAARVFRRRSAPPDHRPLRREALYEGGLSVRTTLDPKMQLIARKAMQNGLIKYDTLRGYRGPVTQIDVSRRLGRAAGRRQGAGRRSRMVAGRRARSLGDRPVDRPAAARARRRATSSRNASKAPSARTTWALPCAMWSTARPSRPSRRPTC